VMRLITSSTIMRAPLRKHRGHAKGSYALTPALPASLGAGRAVLARCLTIRHGRAAVPWDTLKKCPVGHEGGFIRQPWAPSASAERARLCSRWPRNFRGSRNREAVTDPICRGQLMRLAQSYDQMAVAAE
jgi:hypothetical protein